MWKTEQILENARKEDKTIFNYRFYCQLLKNSDVANDFEKYEEAKQQIIKIFQQD